MTGEAHWVRVAVLGTIFEAEQLRAELEAGGIPVLIRDLQPGIFGLGFQGAVPGGVDLCVPSPEFENARLLLGDAAE